MNYLQSNKMSVLGLVLTSLASGCGRLGHHGHGDSQAPGGEAERNIHNVMVLDTGFDPDDHIFDGKIVARYTLTCKDSGMDSATATVTKDSVLQSLRSADDSCSFVEGMTPHISPDFATIAPYRDTWNQYVRSKGTDTGAGEQIYFQEYDISKIIGREDADYVYHGTGTAGLIAYQNPRVRLVLVQMTLGNAGTETQSCPVSVDALQSEISLLQDPDIQAAMIAQPASTQDQQLADLIDKHHIDTINESWGSLSIQGKIAQIRLTCGSSSDKLAPLLQQYEKLVGDYNTKRQKHLDDVLPARTKALVIQSSGNDGYQVDNSSDLAACGERSEHKWLVGAIDDQRSVSVWKSDLGTKIGGSNYGNCVDAYALGTDVIVETPRDFLNAGDGTSYSAPLFVRWLTLQVPAGGSPKDVGDQLRAKLDANRYVPADAVPEDLAYDHKDILMTAYDFSSGQGTPSRRPILHPQAPRTLTPATSVGWFK